MPQLDVLTPAVRPTALLVTNAVGTSRSVPATAARRLRESHQLLTLEVGSRNCDDTDLALDANCPSSDILQRLAAAHLQVVALPYVNQLYAGPSSLVALLGHLAQSVQVEFANGDIEEYAGDDVNRLQYTSAYLHSLFTNLPTRPIERALEFGSSDGLCCDLVRRQTGARVTGIDVWADVGRRSRRPGVTFARANGLRLPFPDSTFDLTYSIATLEHVIDPYGAIREMERVTRPGGFCYLQAGPLYFSPFGHHMFGYFDDVPWIHLRRSPQQIVELGLARGSDAEIRESRGYSLSEYATGMLGVEHINGKRLAEYRLDEIADTPGHEVLLRTTSREGVPLLSPEIRAELSEYSDDDLTAHGFELLYRVGGHRAE